MYQSLPINRLLPLIENNIPLVLLDTACPDKNNTKSYVFINPKKILTAKKISEVNPLLEQIDYFSKKYWVAGYLSYEAAFALENSFSHFGLHTQISDPALGWFGVFSTPYIFDHVTGQWNRPFPLSKNKRGILNINPPLLTIKHAITEKKYKSIISAIKRFIAIGHTYQINFTYDVILQTPQKAFDLYCALRKSQPAPYCSFSVTSDCCIASFSPELFFQKNKNSICVQPMKGTARRGKYPEEDRKISDSLKHDKKNQSENLMIVDLMRNDIGKICITGSVKAPSLFNVQTLPTLHQMTSTITGKLRKSINCSDIFKSIFPCGSVTGAPKIRSMEIIHNLEKGTRNVYCGALGFCDPVGNAVFSVPIRTLQSQRKNQWKYRVGSGIIWDSKASDEWRECAVKCDFLKKTIPEFEIFESLLWNNGFLYKKAHIDRLKQSMQYFLYAFDNKKVLLALKHIEKALKGKRPHKVRIFSDCKGNVRWDYSALIDAVIQYPPPVVMSAHSIDKNNIFLYHKTTYRPWYSSDAEIIKKNSYFDILHVNSRGELTEGSRSNIFILKDSRLFTPSLECGLLPGTLRKKLLSSNKCIEKILKPSDLKKAEAIYCGNSVRGLVKVYLT